MTFADRIVKLRSGNTGDGSYECGFLTAQEKSLQIMYDADELIDKLFDALCDRHADDLVDELKEEYGL